MGKIVRSLTVGMVVGAAVGMMVMPSLDRRTQRAIRKAGRRVKDMTEHSMDWM
ncbi:MAG: YtxH domain-containing protein [Clostridium perfringens]|nr:YtxH domain-containing protein [Clostridium perfringens]